MWTETAPKLCNCDWHPFLNFHCTLQASRCHSLMDFRGWIFKEWTFSGAVEAPCLFFHKSQENWESQSHLFAVHLKMLLIPMYRSHSFQFMQKIHPNARQPHLTNEMWSCLLSQLDPIIWFAPFQILFEGSFECTAEQFIVIAIQTKICEDKPLN